MFQKHNILPHEFYQLEERYKTFMYASELITIDEEIKEAERRSKSK